MGNVGVSLMQDKEGGLVNVFDKTGTEGIFLGHREGLGWIAIEDTTEKGGVRIYKDRESGKIDLYDKTGRRLTGLGYEKSEK